MAEHGQINKQLYELGEPDECWPWIGRVSEKTGYGKKQWFGKTWLAHRWMWVQCRGPIPEGMVINHICGNRSCVNPYHMEVVTQAENCQHGNGAKLSKEQAAFIKWQSDRSAKNAARLAKEMCVSKQLIRDVWAGRAWKNL